jgi:undecaprenyl-diphosphatase
MEMNFYWLAATCPTDLDLGFILSYLERQSTWIFVWYRLLMGLFLIVAVSTHLLPGNG